mgnify:CR=1 FL=1
MVDSGFGNKVISLIGVGKSYRSYTRDIDRALEILTGKVRHYQYDALQPLSLQVAKGEVIGVVGKNGAGKSTLLKLLAGTLQPSSGQLEINGRVSAILELGASFHPEMTGHDNVYLTCAIQGLSRQETAAAYEAIVNFAGIGETWRLLETAIKPHATSARVLAAIETTADLCHENQLTIADIKSIRVGIPKIIQGRLTVNEPKDVQAAQMSLPFCMAMVLARGKDLPSGFTINIDDFDTALADAAVMDISKRIACELDPDAERVSTEQSVGAKVTLTLQSGKTVEKFIEAPKGSASRPFTMEDHLSRFRAEMLRRFAPAQVDALQDEVYNFDRAANPDRLMQLLASRT